jgi:hypothetical protein
MKLLSPIKILTLILCLKLIFPKLNVNKTSEVENYSLKTVKEFKPISYLSYTSYIDLDDFNINVPVKYIYIHNFDIYDISGLLKKSSREDTDYTANLSSIKIIYNFKDLKKTSECNYDGKQVFGISETCEPLAGEMGNGNSWNISFDTDGKRLIQIKLNQEKENTYVTYLLKCSNLKNYDINEEKSSYYNSSVYTNLFLYIETIYACPTYEKFVLYEWIEYFHYFLGVIFILVGLITLIAVTPEGSYCFIFCLIIFISFVSIVQIFFPPMMRFWKIWLILISFTIISLYLFIALVSYFRQIYIKYYFGAFLGFFLGQYFYDLFIEVIIWNSLFFYLLFLSLFIIGGVVLSHFSINIALFLTSSYFGAYIILRGASLFGRYFPSEYILVLLKINGELGQIGQLITWRYYVYNCCAFGLGTFAFFLQFRARKNEWNAEIVF